MMEAILLVLGLGLLVKGADFLVDGAASIARRFNISNIVIGLTIVAFGTSAPELVVNVLASVRGTTEIAIGNILGSNIANIFLILGISAVVYPLRAHKNTVLKEIPFSLLAALMVGVLANDVWLNQGSHDVVSLGDGIVLLSFFAVFLYYTFGIAKAGDSEEGEVKNMSLVLSSVYVLGGLAFLIIGGKWIVDAAVYFATALGISQSVIGLTIVAVGTSLPELATSVVAAYKKQSDIAIGNIVGSNIFNIFFILGISATIAPLPFAVSLDRDIIATILASVVLFGVMYVGKKYVIERWQGVVLIGCYVAYVWQLLV